MIPADIDSVLQWWFMFSLLGIGFLPLSLLLFNKFFDKGYIFARLIGAATTTYVLFLLGVLHVVPFSSMSTFVVAIGLSLLIYLWVPQAKQVLPTLKKLWKVLLFEELIFLVALFAWAYVRSFNPDIHGLEKYMDFGFINSILRGEYFPPKDMWFTPLFINYYYFGHMVTAVLTRLSMLPTALTYNLMIATVFAFCFTASYSLGANLFNLIKSTAAVSTIKRTLSGLLTACLVTLSGNLHIVYAFFKPYTNEKPVPVWDLVFQPHLFPNGYWYPNATRFIYNTIHEFPMYSWIVSDLHGHVLDIPFVLLTVAILLSLFLQASEKKEEQHPTKKATTLAQNVIQAFTIPQINVWYLPVIGFLLAVMYMTNAWDGAIYLLLTGFVLLAILWGKVPLMKMGIALGIVLCSFVITALPYNVFFQPFVSGIGILCAPDALSTLGAGGKVGPFLFEKAHCQHSPWWQLLTLYGFFLFFITSFLIFVSKTKKLLTTDKFVLLLIILGMLLILIPEFIYVKDIYPAHYRANTMFKLVFQAFIVLSLASGYIIVRLIPSIARRWLAITFTIVSIALVTLVMTYPYVATNSYYGNLQNYKGLNGTAYLKVLYPTDYEAIAWLNTTVKGTPVILESQSDSYTDHGRVSVHTGLPTVLGWTVHEWLWRGKYDVPAPRITDVKKLYETADLTEAKRLIDAYNIEYVFIGTLEFQKYPTLNEAKFAQLGKLVYQKGTTKIYQIN